MNASRDELVESCLGLVKTFVHRHYFGRVPDSYLPDLYQAANVGLVRAANAFDYSRSSQFSSFAMYWVRSMLRVEMRNLRGQNTKGVGLVTTSLDTGGVVDGEGGEAIELGVDCPDPEVFLEDLKDSFVCKDADLFFRYEFGSETLDTIGKEYGVTRERIRQRVEKVRPMFEQWAEKIRNEVAS